MCDKCKRFPVPTSNFKEVAISADRQATLFQCNACGTYLEVKELGRGVTELDKSIVAQFYPTAIKV